MASATGISVKYRTPLRQAQRDLTRGRIKDAARNLFYAHHYDATTMDDIALAAGLRRSTLYLHYKDKAEIIAEVIADYAPKARRILGTLAGPRPTHQQLLQWIENVANFVAEERVPLSIILELQRNAVHTPALTNLVSELLAGLGQNNPAFRATASEDADPILRARGLLLLQQLTYACGLYLDQIDNPLGKAILEVTAQDFHAFLSAQT